MSTCRRLLHRAYTSANLHARITDIACLPVKRLQRLAWARLQHLLLLLEGSGRCLLLHHRRWALWATQIRCRLLLVLIPVLILLPVASSRLRFRCWCTWR